VRRGGPLQRSWHDDRHRQRRRAIRLPSDDIPIAVSVAGDQHTATRRPLTVTRRRVAARRRVATPGPGVERCAVDHRERHRGVHSAGARRALDRCGRARLRATRVHTATRARTDPCESANHGPAWVCGDVWRGPRRVATPSPILRERHPGSLRARHVRGLTGGQGRQMMLDRSDLLQQA
jgi:hypothetical protein